MCILILIIATDNRVRNSANPYVRDMSKSLRTCQMSVHGYPADMFIFCNLQLSLLELQEDTPQADIDQDNVSLAGVLQGAVGRAVDTPVFARARCCWTIIRGFHTNAGGTEHAVGTRLDAVFPIRQRLVDADFAAVEIGFYAQCWSCFSELDVGWSEPFLFIFNRKTNYTGNPKLELTSQCLTSDWQLKDCDTFCSMAYIFKWHLNNIRKWLFVFENIID